MSEALLLGVIPPFLLQTEDNPKGVPAEVFEGIKEAIWQTATRASTTSSPTSTTPTSSRRSGSATPRFGRASVAAGSPLRVHACVDTWLT